MDVERVDPARRLRIAVLADFEGPHARSWLRWFVARGHEVHALSFYLPRFPIEGVTMHALHAGPARRQARDGATPPPALLDRLPRGIVRIAHAARYQAAGLRALVQRIHPDVFHAHYLVEHGFYGALAGVRPYVVSAWGSDALVEPQRDPLSRLIARWVIARADLVTSNNAYMARAIGRLGALPSRVQVVTLGAERYDLELAQQSVNRRPHDPARAPVIISTRAHETLYNVADVIDAYRQLLRSRPEARLIVAHSGSQTDALRRRAAGLRDATFIGFLDRAAFREALAYADVFISVPSSDATSVALLQAMAAGCFPIVSDLPTQREWIRDGVNGFTVPLHHPEILAARIEQALADPELRASAAAHNLRLVEERGLNEVQMATLERRYYELAGRAAP